MNKKNLKKSSFIRLVLNGAVILVYALRLKKIHGCDKMIEEIRKKVLERDWTFNEISNLKVTIESLSKIIYLEMKLQERFELLREIRINENFVGHTFEDVMREAVMTTLQGEVAGIIREMLNTATVKFGGNNNEISERSLGGKPHKERTTDEKKSRLSEE